MGYVRHDPIGQRIFEGGPQRPEYPKIVGNIGDLRIEASLMAM
jgi:hypothetical protein